MAYDPNSAYVAPKRAYYGQMQQPAASQNSYQSQVNEQYDEYAQHSRNGGYEPRYDQYKGNATDMTQGRTAQSPQYGDRYQGGHQSRRQQAERPPRDHQQKYQRQDRQYDPRYQQRLERGRQHPSDVQQPTERTRPNPTNARVYPQQVAPPSQSYQRAQAITQSNDTAARPQTTPQQARKPDPSKMTMEEWKAKERAKMHAEMSLPETLAWDNAFPTFPTKRETSRPPTAKRESVELEGSSPPSSQLCEERPGPNRGQSYNSDPIPQDDLQRQQYGRPPLDHKPYSYEPVKEQPRQQEAPPPAQREQQYEGRLSELAGSPINELPAQQPVAAQRPSPFSTQVERRQQTAVSNGMVRQYNQDTPSYQDVRSDPKQPRQSRPRGPPMHPIDTTQPVQTQRSAYMSHQPLSPANVPQRPLTSQGPLSPFSRSTTSPTSASSQAQAPHTTYVRQAFDPSTVQVQQSQVRHGSLNDIYGDSGGNRVAPPVTAPPRTREQEIEAEMPDFDSAAPGGTSLLHKRSQHPNRPINADIAAASPPQVANVPPQQKYSRTPALSAQPQRSDNQQVDTGSSSTVDQQPRKQKQGGITDGFVFELPGGTTHHPTYDDQYLQGMPRQYDTPHELPGPPIHFPFAREPQPRRSMDDGRQMPYRQRPPPQQRMPQSGWPPREPLPPPQRLDVDRNFSEPRVQPPFANEALQRVGSAPPAQQSFQKPHVQAPMGAPLTQQKSAPEQPRHMHRYSNPDSLPHHPPPVRPGLVERGQPQQSKPPLVRGYDNGAAATPHQRQASIEQPSAPVTAHELDQLRASVDANPGNQKQALLLVKKLVEAAEVLASEGGRADPRTVAKNRERYIFDAHKRLKKLVASGFPEAQFYFADCYGQGALGLEVDPKEAFKLYQAAAKNGHPEAAYRTAMCCEMGAEDGGGTSKDYAKAVQWYRRGAALGDPSSMFKVGIISLKGLLGQQRNVGEGASWLRRAADRGDTDNPPAFYELAVLYESANTSPEVRNKVVADDQYALELFQKAANLGHKFAQFRLGQAYEYGNLGVAMDNRASIAWYSKAAAQGEHQAELALSGWYLTGSEGILEHSDTEAYLWARKAASSEPPLPKAMFAMGYFTETGIGCPASVEEARKWYGRAASYRFPKAQERLEELRRSGTKGPRPVNGKLTRKDQKKDEAECVVM